MLPAKHREKSRFLFYDLTLQCKIHIRAPVAIAIATIIQDAPLVVAIGRSKVSAGDTAQLKSPKQPASCDPCK